MQTVQTEQAVQLLCLLFFKTVIYIWLRCVHLFLTLLVTLDLFPIFGHHTTKSYEVLSSSRYLAKQIRGVKFLELVQISPTWQDLICVDRDTDLEVRNVLCERTKW